MNENVVPLSDRQRATPTATYALGLAIELVQALRESKPSASRTCVGLLERLNIALQVDRDAAPMREFVEPIAGLSRRESEILQLVGKGLTNKEIARTLGICPETVKSHVRHIFGKLGVERRMQALSYIRSAPRLVRDDVALPA